MIMWSSICRLHYSKYGYLNIVYFDNINILWFHSVPYGCVTTRWIYLGFIKISNDETYHYTLKYTYINTTMQSHNGTVSVFSGSPHKWPLMQSFGVFFVLEWTNPWTNRGLANDETPQSSCDVTVMVIFKATNSTNPNQGLRSPMEW